MSSIGSVERRTQNRVVALFRNDLGYRYLGDWTDREGNTNIETGLLRDFLLKQGHDKALVERALHVLDKASGDSSKSLYDRNHAVYDLLRYGVKVRPDAGENTITVWLIDWQHPEKNDFAIAEEVSVQPPDANAHVKRPDIVLYVNGIALGVLELKRSTVSVAEGIRQNLDNQKKVFIEHFFSTVQLVMAGNDTEGMRYGSIQTPEKYFLTWKETGTQENLLDRHLVQMCGKARFLELIHDFIVFDAGTKKLCRHNQYFAVRASQERVKRREGGIIWNSQGSGKSLIMVWLTKWLREHVRDSRVLIITDRTELDQQIESVFQGVNEDIYRTKSGADLIQKLNATTPWLICSLIHKFGAVEDGEEVGDIAAYIEEVRRALPPDFCPKGDIYVFVDECHRTQSGELHKAMKAILPNAIFIGFTGTPLLKADKKKSIEVFGGYIHTYKFDEAVRDRVILDLRYEARDIEQRLGSQKKIDEWFAANTKGLTDLAKAQLKQRWGTMQKVLSSQDRLGKIVADILMDFAKRDRLLSGRGNAMLVSGSIYQACKFYELFQATPLKDHCAIVTSYKPTAADIKGEETGEGLTEKLRQYEIYQNMLAQWFNEPAAKAVNRVEEFERAVKKKFVEEPGQMKLLIVVDKLLTGFDAPPATFLYIDKQMQDHGLFQAICRVNRLDGDDKEYGYIIDYKDLFKSLEDAVEDYTSGALDGYDKGDVECLLGNRLKKARERLDGALESARALCEQVKPPKDSQAYFAYFTAKDHDDRDQMKANEPKRLSLYKLTAGLVRAYADIAGEMEEAGYSPTQAEAIREEVRHFENVRDEVKQHSGDAIDLKRYEPAMRHLIDAYIRAEDSEKVTEFDDLSLIQLIVQRGEAFVKDLPEGIQKNQEAVAETIENNVRKLIIDEQPINPKYYEKMSELLDALIAQRQQMALAYAEYLEKIIRLTKQVVNPGGSTDYPAALDTSGKRALYDNLDRDESLALAVHAAVLANRQDSWRGNRIKTLKIKFGILGVLDARETGKDSPAGAAPAAEAPSDAVRQKAEAILEIVRNQNEY